MMARSFTRTSVLAFLCIALAAGCGGGGGGDTPDADADADDATETGPDGVDDVEPETVGDDSVTFIVVTVDGDANVPLEGCTVAFDLPGGGRSEDVTGADGKVTFDGFDWSLGLAAVTAHCPDLELHSRVNLDEDALSLLPEVDGAPAIVIIPDAPPTTVNVRGTATGMVDDTRKLVVNVIDASYGTEWQGTGRGTFSVQVPYDETFMLQAMEVEDEMLPSGQGYDMTIHQVMQHGFDGVTAPLIDAVLDFTADSMTTHTADGSVATPTRGDSPIRDGFPVCLVCASNSPYCFGWATHIDISTDGNTFDFSLLWVEPTWPEDVVTLCRVSPSATSTIIHSFVFTDGYPTAGSIGTLPDVPGWITPEDPTAAHPLHEAIEWETFDAGLQVAFLTIRRGSDVAWQLWSGSGGTSMTVPEPPSSVDPAGFLGTADLRAVLLVGEMDPDYTGMYLSLSRGSNSDQILLEP